MSYLPDLIPKQSKVLGEYFKNNKKTSDIQEKKSADVLMLLYGLIGVVCCAVALLYLSHFSVLVLLLFLGFVSFPFGKRYMERKLRFDMTSRIRATAYGIGFVLLIPLMSVAYKNDLKSERLLAVQAKNKEEANVLILKKETNRKDSLQKYMLAYRKPSNSPKLALCALASAKLFALSTAEQDSIARGEQSAHTLEGNYLIKKGQYIVASEIFSALIKDYPDNPSHFYYRALCLYRLKKVKEAVADLTESKAMGYERAEALYDKVNPLRKRVAYYETRCCDGTTSSATGRGACSWHGGVCNWSAPVYEEYRKY
jgi:hypothetical protein